jgi:virginiamycin A acetyltransferase
MFRRALKKVFQGFAILLTLPAALLAGFGRFAAGFEFFAQGLALAPGLPGSYLRVAYYAMTLRRCSLDSYVGMGSFFSHAEASVARRVYIGSMCILGRVHIGEGTMIASGVQVPSGSRQHTRNQLGEMTDEGGRYEDITIGAHCWIGASAVVMASVGDKSTVAAGAVVVDPVQTGTVVGGVPAKPIAAGTLRE